MFFYDILRWSDRFIFSSWYVFLIVINILHNKTLFLNICFIPISPFLRSSPP